MELVVDQEYQTVCGPLYYGGFYTRANYRCEICGRMRWNIHEFYAGLKDDYNLSYHCGTECVKKFVKVE